MHDIYKGEFAEDMIFSKSLKTTTSSADIYGTLKNNLHVSNIPIENIHLVCGWCSCYDGQEKRLLKNNER